MQLHGANILVTDLETLRSADDCRHCDRPLRDHYADGACAPWTGDKPSDNIPQFSAIGWNDHAALGLAIGGYFDYADGQMHWFDHATLATTLRTWVARAPLLVSYNGLTFDFPLMSTLLIQEVESVLDLQKAPSEFGRLALQRCVEEFTTLCTASYDILDAIWQADPEGKYTRGLNSLDAVAQANGLGAKIGHGAHAPRDWQAGRIATVLNYCQDDVLKTKALFELVLSQGFLLRSDGRQLTLPVPFLATDQEIPL